MTIEQRLDQLEQQNHRIELKNKRLTAALTLTVVAMCAAVTMAATGEKDGQFDSVVADSVMARTIFVANDDDNFVVSLGANDAGDGMVVTQSAQGKEMVRLGGSADGNGGMINVFNKTGEDIVQMYADEYGNGVVGVYNRKGMGRTLQPGPRCAGEHR